MPKIPKKIPSWFESFATFAKSKEKKRDVQNSIDIFTQVLTARWPEFIEQTNQDSKSAPAPKSRKTDPIKNLGKAMEKVSCVVEEAQDNNVLLDQIKDSMKGCVPENIKPMLSEIVGGSGLDVTDMDMVKDDGKISLLLSGASKGLDELTNINQQLSIHAKESGSVNLQDLDVSNKVLNQVADNINQIKKSFS
jgi:hypothetical protein